MNILALLAKRSARQLSWALLASTACGACNIILLAVVNGVLWRSQPGKHLLAIFVSAGGALLATRFASEMLLARLGQRALLDLRLQLSRKIAAAPLRQIEQLGSAKLLTLVTEDTPTISQAIVQIPTIAMNAMIVVGGLCYLGWLSPRLLGSLAVAVALGMIAYYVPLSQATAQFRLAREASDQLMSGFRGVLFGFKELKLNSNHRDAHLAEHLERPARVFESNNLSAMRKLVFANAWGQLLVFALVGIVLFGVPQEAAIDLRATESYPLILLYLMTPIQVLMGAMPALGRANAAFGRLTAVSTQLSDGSGFGSTGHASWSAASWRRIELVDCRYRFDSTDTDGGFDLGPVNLTLERGTVTFITGGNGSGKTTLLKLLTGLYTPTAGEVRVDGETVTDEKRGEYRHLFSAIFADSYLFERVSEAATPESLVYAEQWLLRLELAHKSRIEDGCLVSTDLSTGQRKRLALLRAVMENRSLLMLDEWAADQDPRFRRRFYEELVPEFKRDGRTVIAVTHDDRYFGAADHVIAVDSGCVVRDERSRHSYVLELAGS